MFCQKLQQFILIAHRVTFVNKITDGIVVDQCVEVASFFDGRQVDVDLGLGEKINFLFLVTGEANQHKQQDDAENPIGPTHRTSKILLFPTE